MIAFKIDSLFTANMHTLIPYLIINWLERKLFLPLILHFIVLVQGSITEKTELTAYTS